MLQKTLDLIQNPFVVDFPWLKSYSGVPLVNPSVYNIGTLCFSDIKPRSVTDNDIFILKTLAIQVITTFEL